MSHARGILPLQSSAHLGNVGVVHLDNDRHVLLVCRGAFPQIFGRRKCSAAAGGASNPTHCLQSEPTYNTSRVRDVQSIRSDQATAAQIVAASHIKAGTDLDGAEPQTLSLYYSNLHTGLKHVRLRKLYPCSVSSLF